MESIRKLDGELNECLAKAEQARPKTVGEMIDEAIEHANREIARLVALRDTCRTAGMLDLPQPLVASAAHPGSPW